MSSTSSAPCDGIIACVSSMGASLPAVFGGSFFPDESFDSFPSESILRDSQPVVLADARDKKRKEISQFKNAFVYVLKSAMVKLINRVGTAMKQKSGLYLLGRLCVCLSVCLSVMPFCIHNKSIAVPGRRAFSHSFFATAGCNFLTQLRSFFDFGCGSHPSSVWLAIDTSEHLKSCPQPRVYKATKDPTSCGVHRIFALL